jgi:hypothetical protein
MVQVPSAATRADVEKPAGARNGVGKTWTAVSAQSLEVWIVPRSSSPP